MQRGQVLSSTKTTWTCVRSYKRSTYKDIRAENELTISKLDDAIDYTRDIKSGIRDDLLAIEKSVDRMEDKVRKLEDEVRISIDNAEERFEDRRNTLSDDYDEALDRLKKEIEDLEEELEDKIQKALDNPLSDG